eukprot:1547463-Lingulodinium_polyedra.AAC.1
MARAELVAGSRALPAHRAQSHAAAGAVGFGSLAPRRSRTQRRPTGPGAVFGACWGRAGRPAASRGAQLVVRPQACA